MRRTCTALGRLAAGLAGMAATASAASADRGSPSVAARPGLADGLARSPAPAGRDLHRCRTQRLSRSGRRLLRPLSAGPPTCSRPGASTRSRSTSAARARRACAQSRFTRDLLTHRPTTPAAGCFGDRPALLTPRDRARWQRRRTIARGSAGQRPDRQRQAVVAPPSACESSPGWHRGRSPAAVRSPGCDRPGVTSYASLRARSRDARPGSRGASPVATRVSGMSPATFETGP